MIPNILAFPLFKSKLDNKLLMYRYIHFIIAISVINTLHGQYSEEQIIIDSEALHEERLLKIALPEDYYLSERAYPIIYLLDGEYIFDFAKGSVEFMSNEFNYYPDAIIVSVPNTDRMRDFNVNLQKVDSMNRFARFMIREVFVTIESHFRTNGYRILYGWSSGSAICDYFMVKYPEYIDGYIFSGCGIGPKTRRFIKDNINPKLLVGKHLYINVEDEDLRKPGFLMFKHLLDSMDLGKTHIRFEIIEESSHVDVLAQGFLQGLKFIYKDYLIPQEEAVQGVQNILAYYSRLSKDYHVSPIIPLGAINEIAGALFLSR